MGASRCAEVTTKTQSGKSEQAAGRRTLDSSPSSIDPAILTTWQGRLLYMELQVSM